MKKPLFLFLFLLLLNLFVLLKAQTYHSMLVKGRTWDELHFAPELCWADYGVRNTLPSTDSLIGMSWSSVIYSPVIAGSPNFCPPYSVDTTTWSVAGYSLREDTAARQVFIESPSMSSNLLYDFSLSVGDTFSSTYATQDYPFVVTAITDVTLLDGSVVKQFDFSPEGWYMERIGGWQGMYGPLYLLEFPMQTKCVSQDGVALWDNGICFGILAAKNPLAAHAVQVFPNPASDRVEITLPSQSAWLLELFDATGNKVSEDVCQGGGASADVGHLTPGLYHYKVSGSDGIQGGRLLIMR